MRNIRDGTALSLTDDLVSATPQIDSEVLAPTPPQPIVETAGARSGARRPTDPATGAPATGATGDRRARDDRHPDRCPQGARRCRSAARHARGLAAGAPRRVAAAVQPCGSQPRRLTERRIGLLFAVFLALLALRRPARRLPARLQGRRPQAARRHAAGGERHVIAKRGTITDRNGAELAVSEDASTIFATPFLIKDPVGTARRVAPLIDRPEPRCWRCSPTARRASPTSPARSKAASGAQGRAAEDRGHRRARRLAPLLPRGRAGRAGVGSVGVDNKGLSGLEQQLDERACAAPTASSGS